MKTARTVIIKTCILLKKYNKIPILGHFMVKSAQMRNERLKTAESVPDELSVWKMMGEARRLAFEGVEKGSFPHESSFRSTFPTRHLKFPEVDTNVFASNLRNFEAKSALLIEFSDSHYSNSVRGRVYVPERTTVAIFTGVENGKAVRFKIEKDHSLPSVISYTRDVSKVSMNKGKEEIRPITIDDLDSFNAAIEFAKKNRQES